MRCTTSLGVLFIAMAVGCASVTRPVTSPGTPPGVANPPASAEVCDCSAPPWATCLNPGCANTQPPCGTYQPCQIPTGIPPTTQDPTCKMSYGRQCEDGKPPIANPAPSAGACHQTGTPCGLGAPADGKLQFAVIGDWGDMCCQPSCAGFIADMIHGWASSWPLDFIITLGDNFYPRGSADDL